jgi:hypothetical protein
MKCGVLADDTLRLEVKDYRMRAYDMVCLSEMRAWQTDALFAQCCRDVVRGVGFNARGFWTNFVVPRWARTDRRGDAVFCSEHVVRALQEAKIGVAVPLIAYETTPRQVYDWVRASGLVGVGLVGNMHVRGHELVV